MSETPPPLWQLVEQWETLGYRTVGREGRKEIQRCARQLIAALRAWNEELGSEEWQIYMISRKTVREQVLGVPPKEPPQKDSTSLGRSAKG